MSALWGKADVDHAPLNVPYWLKADIPAYVDLGPLLGVKRTFPATDFPMLIYEYTA